MPSNVDILSSSGTGAESRSKSIGRAAAGQGSKVDDSGRGPVLVWFRQDLALAGNPAWRAAIATGRPVVPVYLRSEDDDGDWPPGAASRWWLHHSLVALRKGIEAAGLALIVGVGRAAEVLPRLAAQIEGREIHWNDRAEPASRALENALEARFERDGVLVQRHTGAFLVPPGSMLTASGTPYRVFTPFWSSLLARVPRVSPSPPRGRVAPYTRPLESDRIEELALLPEPDWAAGLRSAWSPGGKGARQRLVELSEGIAPRYAAMRDVPSEAGTSRLSPHLHFGEVTPLEVWSEVAGAREPSGAPGVPRAAEPFLRQLAWREFAMHVLVHSPRSAHEPWNEAFRRFPWREDETSLRAWQRGKTGYPIVDAGMHELWRTGWMHNRVRLIVASFLTKHLLIHWREGAAWFWDTLVDADLANNTMGWQWVAGSGTDAAPYFRVFNPTLQGKKFDPDGAYVRRWVPALRRVPPPWIHEPWKGSPLALREAGVALGETYPLPIVEHEAARERALSAYARMRSK